MDVVSFPRSQRFRDLGISVDEYTTLSSAADINVGGKKQGLGKKAMFLVDTDRNEYAKEKGYRTFEFTMHPDNCTPKNHIIVGVHSESSDKELSHAFFNEVNQKLTLVIC